MDKIIECIMDDEKWPAIELPDNLELLNEIADQEFDAGTFSGMLAAILMYHQIIEAMCIHLLDNCHFLTRLALYPFTIQFKSAQSKMLGSYLKDLKESVDFKDKNIFIGKVEEFNQLRNGIVHKMRRSNETELVSVMSEGKKLFDQIFELYDNIQDDFRATFHGYQKDVFNDYM